MVVFDWSGMTVITLILIERVSFDTLTQVSKIHFLINLSLIDAALRLKISNFDEHQ